MRLGLEGAVEEEMFTGFGLASAGTHESLKLALCVTLKVLLYAQRLHALVQSQVRIVDWWQAREV